MHTSETSHVRSLLSQWCIGYGVDLGAGGDKIVPHAIALDTPIPYTCVGTDPVQLGGDARNLHWFNNGTLNFVYSSHLLEDFEDTVGALNEWARVLVLGGYLILYLPDEQKYRARSQKEGARCNPSHKHAHFNAQYVKDCIKKVSYRMKLIHESGIINHYSFALVYQKNP